jgi:hypothetical protein
MSLGVDRKVPGSARVSRVGDRVLATTDFLSDALLRQRLFWRDAKTSTRDAFATQASAKEHASVNWT